MTATTTTALTRENGTSIEGYLDYIKQRRSIRNLQHGDVSDATIRHIVEAARWSPSSFNSQPVRLVVLKARHEEFWDFAEAQLRAKLTGDQLTRATSRLPGYRAGVFTILFFEDTTVAANPPMPGGEAVWKSFAVQAMGIAQVNVWNAVAAAGLATSNQHVNFQIGDDALRAFLGLPETWVSYSVFPVGYPNETPAESTRKPHEEVAYYEYGPEHHATAAK